LDIKSATSVLNVHTELPTFFSVESGSLSRFYPKQKKPIRLDNLLNGLPYERIALALLLYYLLGKGI
jgi:hypothetical protein